MTPPLQTEFPFRLPRGYADARGGVHRDGVMRLATALDEIAPARDPRVRDNPAYLPVVLLARVVVRLGTLVEVTTGTIESLFAGDLAYLQDFYQRVNADGSDGRVVCPNCQHRFRPEEPASGEP